MRKIKHLLNGIKGALIVAFSFLLFPFARLLLWHKKIWIISEYGYEARDNGYNFFTYIRDKHKEINCYYAIDFNSTDYNKVAKFGNVIKFGSFRHFAYWCAARFLISSKTQGFCPSYYLTLLRQKMHLWGKYVFLQHGITKDDQKFLYKKESKIDLFICGAKPEYDDIRDHYGYKNYEVAYTGFARFDNYHNIKAERQIFVMPTWRRYASNTNFVETDYYKTWSSFINSVELNDILIKSDIVLYFYLHPLLRENTELFHTKCSNIKILPFEKTDIQEMILKSELFITDFSSLAFDFGYMLKPVIYYQYDENEYFKGHYIKGYFDYRRDGFGPVCIDLNNLLASIAYLLKNNCNLLEKYRANSERFFPLRDNKNCKRIYDAILNYSSSLRNKSEN